MTERAVDPLHALRVGTALLRGLWVRLIMSLVAGEAQIGRGLRCFGAVRLTNLRRGTIRLGTHVTLGNGWLGVLPGARLDIGDHVSINQGFTLVCTRAISIGRETRIGEFVSIRDQDHRFDRGETAIREQGYLDAPIAIGANVWIGRGVAILKGVTIGDGAVVGANAVVTRDVAPGTVVGGIPAKPLARREARV